MRASLGRRRGARTGQADTAAVGVDLAHLDLEVGADREAATHLRPTRDAGQRVGHQPDAAGAEPNEDAVVFDALDLAGDLRTGLELGERGRIEPLDRWCDRDASILRLYREHQPVT